MNERCDWCHTAEPVEGAALCRECLDALSSAYDADWRPSDFEGLPFVIRYLNSVQFSVRSEKQMNVWYIVDHDYAEGTNCRCPSHNFRPIGPCKHMQAITYALIRRENRLHSADRGESPLATTPNFSLYR